MISLYPKTDANATSIRPCYRSSRTSNIHLFVRWDSMMRIISIDQWILYNCIHVINYLWLKCSRFNLVESGIGSDSCMGQNEMMTLDETGEAWNFSLKFRVSLCSMLCESIVYCCWFNKKFLRVSWDIFSYIRLLFSYAEISAQIETVKNIL